MRRLFAPCLAVFSIALALYLGDRARSWNDELGVVSPFARTAPMVSDPHTPRLTDRVVLITIDGLGIAESRMPFLDELRGRGVAAVAQVPYPTISRPNYVTILTGVPPEDSGVRANRVRIPVAVDSVMDRVQAAHLRVATAGDMGMMPSLFARHTRSLSDIGWIEMGNRIAPPSPITWPVDEARRAPSLEALAPIISDFASEDFAFVPVLVLDVDRAGHAHGVGTEYRAAAAAVDQMIRAAVAKIDLAHTTVIITADHGHVAPGGHGGPEPEVSHVPLILVGKGIRTGAKLDAHLIDVAPTVAALLGVPAPGHAEGRTLVDALELSPDERDRRLAADAARGTELARVIDSAHANVSRPKPVRLMIALGGLVLAIGLVILARRRGVIALDHRAPVAWLGFVAMIVAMGAVTRWQFSPSYVPSLAVTVKLTAIGIAVAILIQVLASTVVVLRAPDRLAAASGLAMTGVTASLFVLGFVRAWFSMPFVIVPSPFWIVAVPAVELATAACAIGAAITILVGAIAATRSG